MLAALRASAGLAPRPPGTPSRKQRPDCRPRALPRSRSASLTLSAATASVPVARAAASKIVDAGRAAGVNRRENHLLKERKENLRHLGHGLVAQATEDQHRELLIAKACCAAPRAAPRLRPDYAPHRESTPRRRCSCRSSRPGQRVCADSFGNRRRRHGNPCRSASSTAAAIASARLRCWCAPLSGESTSICAPRRFDRVCVASASPSRRHIRAPRLPRARPAPSPLRPAPGWPQDAAAA